MFYMQNNPPCPGKTNNAAFPPPTSGAPPSFQPQAPCLPNNAAYPRLISGAPPSFQPSAPGTINNMTYPPPTLGAPSSFSAPGKTNNAAFPPPTSGALQSFHPPASGMINNMMYPPPTSGAPPSFQPQAPGLPNNAAYPPSISGAQPPAPGKTNNVAYPPPNLGAPPPCQPPAPSKISNASYPSSTTGAPPFFESAPGLSNNTAHPQRTLDAPPSFYPPASGWPNNALYQQSMGLPPDSQNNLYGMNQMQQNIRYLDLMQERNILGFEMKNNDIVLPSSVCNPDVHCSPSIFRCTLSAIPETSELLNKCRLPLGLTLQPFRDLKNLTVIQTTIVRCRYCRTYINPYVYLIDHRHWKCNLCFRMNDLPEEFCWDPATKSFGEPFRRPELQNSTIEYIAPSEYMLRSPQPALYLFILDVGATAVDCGYLHTFAEQLVQNIDQLPGDERTLIGFMAIDSAIHFFQFVHPDQPPKQMVVFDVDDNFLPVNNGLVVELRVFKQSVLSFVESLPTIFETSSSSGGCCLGAAIKVARDMISEIGGRISVFLASNVSVGPGALNEPDNATTKNSKITVMPSTDFYKSVALELTFKQVSVDLFCIGERYMNLATLADISKYSSGSVYHFPAYHFLRDQTEIQRFAKQLTRYLTRKIGFEAVLRIRCSKGVSLHTFHGNFFVRSTDLLAMANVNPDSALAVQIQIDENLADQNCVCFQAALLYTSSKGDRRIRVHTLCIPVENDISKLFFGFDVKATVSLLAKMAVERAVTGADLMDCREAFINAATDALVAYNKSVGQRATSILVPLEGHLKFITLFVLGLLKHRTFSTALNLQKGVGGGSSVAPPVSIDQRVAAMQMLKTAPLEQILLEVCPALYAIHNILECEEDPQRLPLSYERVNRDGVYLMDTGSYVYVYVCQNVAPSILRDLFDVGSFNEVDEDERLYAKTNDLSQRVHIFIRKLFLERGIYAPVVILREDSQRRALFTSRLIEDRTESTHSYVEFLQHLRREMSSS